MSTRRLLARPLTLILLAVVSLSAGAAAGRAPLPGSVPSWGNSKNYVAPADASQSIGFRVYLRWKDPAAVLSLAQAVSDPRSPSYRPYLTPAQFRQQFDP